MDISIKRGQDFATIDFEKTTSLLKGKPWEEKKEVIEAAVDKHLKEVDGELYSFYRVPPLKPLQHRKAHRIVSTLFELRDEIRTWRSLGIGSLIAFFGLTVSLLGFGANLYRQNADLNRQLSDTQNELREATERISRLENSINGGTRTSPANAPVSKPSNGPSPKEGQH